ELQQLRPKEWRDEILSAKNRLFRFLTSPALTRFMGLPGRTLDLKAVMDEGKVLLVNLAPSDDLSEENARVFGALLVNEFFECARRRQKDSRGRDPQPYYLYMDEFQNFVSLDIADMLDQVRKFGLFTVLSHQRFGQLDENITDAVLTNCRIKAVFGGLTAPSARLMAEELFINKLDAEKIKVAIYQTKFWPKEETRQVHTHSTSHTSSSGWSEGSSSGSLTTSSTGEFFGPEQWFGSGSTMGTSTSRSSGDSSSSTSGSSGSDSYGDSESVADIPVFVPVPFKELSSVQYFSLEEQLTELTAALKEQYARHCFIRLPGEEAEPMLVPKVESFYTAPQNIRWYEDKLLAKNHALPAAEVDTLIAAQDTALLTAASQTIDITQTEEKEPGQVKATAGQRKANDSGVNIFDDLLKKP
ncbi:MAG: TraM recognition domain-containing protein, partial [Candidatus Dormibacteraceae bacterium]